MGRMPAAGQHKFRNAAAGDAATYRPELRERAVGVILALDQQQRAGNGGQEARDVPRAEFRGKPDLVPAAEGGFGVVVIAGEPGLQIARQAARAARAPAIVRSSTKTCGAIRTSARTAAGAAPA